MRPWPILVAGGAGGLVLLLAFLVGTASGPARRDAGEDDRHPQAVPRAETVEGGNPPHDIPQPSAETEDADDRLRPIPGTERWHYERLLRLAAEDADRFERLADERTNSDAPLEERIALLRAAWDLHGAEALPRFESVLKGGRSPDGPEDALRAYVVRHLAAQATASSEVWTFLRDAVFLGGAASPRDRGEAGRAVLRAADPAAIATLRAALLGMTDTEVVESALVGLGLNPHADAASALDWISLHHPQARVRNRAAEIARQRLAGEVAQAEEDD